MLLAKILSLLTLQASSFHINYIFFQKAARIAFASDSSSTTVSHELPLNVVMGFHMQYK